jgi:hypothetical protein
MLYHPDDFERLVDTIEASGGTHMPGPHRAKKFKLKMPNGPDGKPRWTEVFTVGCERETRFLVPYAVPKGRLGKKMLQRGAGLVEVCAVDDDMGKWPRFRNAVQEDSF